MAEEQKSPENEQKAPIDLSALSDLQFQTAWTPSSSTSERSFSGDRSYSHGGKGSRFRSEGFRQRSNFGGKKGDSEDKDKSTRRSFGSKRKFDGDKKFGDRKFGGRKFERSAPFKPTMEVLFYPDDTPFAKMSEEMKRLKRTYQLFEIAHLILGKDERFILLAKNLPDAEGKIAPLYCAQPSNVPFEDEQSARTAALSTYVNDMFEKVLVDCEPPKGNFQVVNKCGITGELLGAPNWHKYEEHVRDYHRRNFPKMPYEAFLSKIETIRDEAEIAKWIENMKKKEVFKLKEVEEGSEPMIFDTWDSAAAYVSQKKGAALVKVYEQVRMRGANLAQMPSGRIKRNIEEALKGQRRFPIVTANNLRGRLRRTGFSIYKRGSKSFAFVSSVKRKFLLEGESLSELPQEVFNFVSDHVGIKASEVPFKLYGISITDKKDTPKTDESGSEETAKPSITDDDKKKMTDAARELVWLISEGYVVEYSDGTLQANPRMPKPKEKKHSETDKSDESNLGAADDPIVADVSENRPEEHKESSNEAASDEANKEEIDSKNVNAETLDDAKNDVDSHKE